MSTLCPKHNRGYRGRTCPECAGEAACTENELLHSELERVRGELVQHEIVNHIDHREVAALRRGLMAANARILELETPCIDSVDERPPLELITGNDCELLAGQYVELYLHVQENTLPTALELVLPDGVFATNMRIGTRSMGQTGTLRLGHGVYRLKRWPRVQPGVPACVMLHNRSALRSYPRVVLYGDREPEPEPHTGPHTVDSFLRGLEQRHPFGQ